MKHKAIAGIVLALLLGMVVLPIAYGVRYLVQPKESRQALRQLDPTNCPDPAKRSLAVRTIIDLALAGRSLSGWQDMQDKALKDPDPAVRIATLKALGDLVDQKPDQVVVKTLGTELLYMNTEPIAKLGRDDPAPEVRVAVAEFWARADALWRTGVKSLEDMLANEKDPTVINAVRAALARRLERSVTHGDINEQDAKAIRERNNIIAGPSLSPEHK